MGVSRSIEIKLRPKKQNIKFTDILMILNSKHTIPFKKMKSFMYLPLGDQDDFDWKESNDLEEVLKIIDLKEKRHETLGFIIHLDDEDKEAINVSVFNYGIDNTGQFYEINFILGIGKRLNNANRYTDYSWYLEKFLGLFEQDYHISSINCNDID